MSILEDTEAYESWLGAQCEVVEKGLARKHERMREDPFAFLRATYYRWARRIEKICPELADAPSALCVGDIHLENFRTWRDADGRWVWGVNDLDEAAVMPYAFDLVRLTASVQLAPKMNLAGRDAADAILEGYREGLKQPGPALLDEQEIWIRSYVKCSDDCRRKFWKEIEGLKPAAPQRNMAALEQSVIKDNTLMPGEWYGGQLHLAPPVTADGGGPKTYTILITVGTDRHVIDIAQGPSGA